MEIEEPLGEQLPRIGTNFFAAVSSENLAEADGYFSLQAQVELSLEEFEAFIETNKELFAGLATLACDL